MTSPFERAPDTTPPPPLSWNKKPISVVFTGEEADIDPNVVRCIGTIDQAHPGGLEVKMHFEPIGPDSYNCHSTIAVTTTEAGNNNRRRRIRRAVGQLGRTLHNEYTFPGYQDGNTMYVEHRSSERGFLIKRVANDASSNHDSQDMISITAVDTRAENDSPAVLSSKDLNITQTVVELARITGMIANSVTTIDDPNEQIVFRVSLPGVTSEQDPNPQSEQPGKKLARYTGVPGHESYPLLANLGGLRVQIDAIREWVDDALTPQSLLKKYGVDKPGALLLEGIAGTGKTSVVRGIAREYGYKLNEVSVTDILDPYVGTTQRNLRELYESTQKGHGGKPVILFFDEFDGLFTNNAGGNSGLSRSLIAEFKTILTSTEYPLVLTVAAANSIDGIDPALLRQGRFDRTVKFPLPNLAAREEIWRTLIYKRAGMFAVIGEEVLDDASILTSMDEIKFADLAALTEEMSPADINGIVAMLMRQMMRHERKTGIQPYVYGHEDVIRAIGQYRQNRPSSA